MPAPAASRYFAFDDVVRGHKGLDAVPPVSPQSVAVLAYDAAMAAQGRQAIASIRTTGPAGLAIVVLNLGFGDAEAAWLAGAGVRVLPVPPAIPLWTGAPGHARAMSVRPYLPTLLPEYDVICWVDSDIRFLRDDALAIYLRAARLPHRPITIAVELDTAYVAWESPVRVHWLARERLARLESLFGREAAEVASLYPQMNAGLWAMHRDSPVWALYREHLEMTLARPFTHVAEQDALNLAVMASGMNAFLLPATFNWICSMAHPVRGGGPSEWLRPHFPYVPLSVVHLTAQGSPAIVAGHTATYRDLYLQTGLLAPT